jgi:hypothetical protein
MKGQKVIRRNDIMSMMTWLVLLLLMLAGFGFIIQAKQRQAIKGDPCLVRVVGLATVLNLEGEEIYVWHGVETTALGITTDEEHIAVVENKIYGYLPSRSVIFDNGECRRRLPRIAPLPDIYNRLPTPAITPDGRTR